MSVELSKKAKEMADEILSLLREKYLLGLYEEYADHLKIFISTYELLKSGIDISAIYLPLLWLEASIGVMSLPEREKGKRSGYTFFIPKNIARQLWGERK